MLSSTVPPENQSPSTFPPITANRAYPVAHDRWERIETLGRIDASIDVVWNMLTGSEHVGRWLATCSDRWAKQGEEAILDFEDGETFFCRTTTAQAPNAGHAELVYNWRWNGIGPASLVSWMLDQIDGKTEIRVVEESKNGPNDWRTWNGMGWPGIVDQLSDHIRTGRDTRWTWRRMGPFIQAEIPSSTFQAWNDLMNVAASQQWLARRSGDFSEGSELNFVMGDASGEATMRIVRHLEPNQDFPSYQPKLFFALERPGWPNPLQGLMWIEPAGLNQSLLQVFHHGWEGFGSVAPRDRFLLTNFWVNAMARAQQMFAPSDSMAAENISSGPHVWSR